ncbi:MAG: hypothetical protein QNK92_02945 [Amylibacter sp.]
MQRFLRLALIKLRRSDVEPQSTDLGAWGFILFALAGFLRGTVMQILMFGLVAVLLEKGKFFYKNYFGSARSVNDAWIFGLGVVFGAIVVLRPALEW